MVGRSSRLSWKMFSERTREEIVGYRVDVSSFHSQIERTSSDEKTSGRLSLLGKAEAKDGKVERNIIDESISRDLRIPVGRQVPKRKKKMKRFIHLLFLINQLNPRLFNHKDQLFFIQEEIF